MANLSIPNIVARRSSRAQADGTMNGGLNINNLGANAMRVMVIVKANPESEAGVLPSTEILTKMGKYNEELVKAGIMLAGDGLRPSSKGKRIKFDGLKRTITDGPFSETKELIAGFWIWQV